MENNEKIDNLDTKKEKCNDFEDLALQVAGDLINKSKHNPEPASSDFQERLKRELLEKRQGLNDMENKPTFWSIVFKPKKLIPLIATIVLVALVWGTINYWPEDGQKIVNVIPKKAEELFSGFSKLVINPAYANDNFKLTPSSFDSMGASPKSYYTLTSKTELDVESIKESIEIEPAIEYNIKEISKTEWQIIPNKELDPNTFLKVVLKSSYEEDGIQKERDFSWAYQVRDTLKIIYSIPRDTGTDVPLSSGIEITMSHDNISLAEFEKYFSILPSAKGRFEKHGRTFVFVPENSLKSGSIYTVIVKNGLPVENSDHKLSEDYQITFETERDSSNYLYDSWFYIYQRFYEFKSGERPVIQISINNDFVQTYFRVELYKYKSEEQYLESVKKIDSLPWWTYSKENYEQDVKELDKQSDFGVTIKQEGHIKYFEFPEGLTPGYYIAQVAGGKQIQQIRIQITDLSAYLNISKTNTIVWVNDLQSSSPVNNAQVELIGTNIISQTDTKGIAIFPTPSDIIKSANERENNKIYYLKVTKGYKVLYLPASKLTNSYYYDSSYSLDDDYWMYFYNDRPMYQTTDTIKYWGMIKKRDGSEVDKKATVTLYKEGYVDYYYQPVRILEKEIGLNDFDTFSGELKFENLKPDYYTMEIKIGDDVVKRKYLNIEPYVKPAYNLTLIPDKRNVYADDTINLKVKASFFEGTPVPDIDLIFNMPNGQYEFKTDENGEANLTYNKKYYDCNDDYSCWPDYEYLSVSPKNSEIADISAETSIYYYGPENSLRTEIDYPEKGIAEIKFRAISLDLKKIEDGFFWWSYYNDEETTPYPGAKIEAQITKIKYEKIETGTRYDFINKKTYKTYSYNKIETNEGNFELLTGKNGEAIYRMNVEPETSYSVSIKAYDKNGRYDKYSTYLYYYDGIKVNRYGGLSYPYYHFDYEASSDAYNVNDSVDVSMLNGDELLPEGENKYLFLQYQNGLQEYEIADKAEYVFKFEERDIPNINLMGVYFNGTSYDVTSAGWDGYSINYNKENKTLILDVQTDKDMYEPGEEVELSIEVKDLNGKAQEAEVNLNLIDEAYYAIVEDTADPLSEIYTQVGVGTIYSKYSHYSQINEFGGVEKGGCFLAGTMIEMADGSQKKIEEIEKGDMIKTFINPVSRQKDNGEVIETFHHVINDYLIINNSLKVTPDHLIFSNNRFIEAYALKVGDWLLRSNGQKEFIKTIYRENKTVNVYNFTVDPQHTYFAEGYYVHNEKGGGPREVFTDAALFTSIRTNKNGRAKTKFKLPDNITSWRVTAQAITDDLYAGTIVKAIPVSLPVFAEIAIGNEYLVDDKPIAKLRAFGRDLRAGDSVNFSVKALTLGVVDGAKIVTKAFKSVFYELPKLKIGKHDLVYELTSKKGNDAIKLPINVISSRFESQVAENEILTLDSKVEVKDNLPVVVVLSDEGQSQYYPKLQNLSWSYGDRIDQILTRLKSRELLNKYYSEDYEIPEFNGDNYQLYDGGITLLPYSDQELELTARIANIGSEEFDQEALAQYLFNVLNNKDANREEITYALFGLASLEKPVLPRIQAWLSNPDLSAKEKLYLTQAIYDLGAHEWARSIYFEVLEKYGKEKAPRIVLEVSENKNETFHTTALAAVLASSLNLPEKDSLWEGVKYHYTLKNFEPDVLISLEEYNFIKKALPNIKPSPVKVSYELEGKKMKVELTGGQIHSFQVSKEEAGSLKFKEIEGDVVISKRYIQPFDYVSHARDEDIKIRREYFVNGKKTNEFKENDIIEIRLYASFNENAIDGLYQITDILPSGLIPMTNYYRPGYSYNCNIWYPYNTDGQKVKYQIDKNWKSWHCSSYIGYYAKVKTKGNYKAEPAIIQSYKNSDYLNYSEVEWIKID